LAGSDLECQGNFHWCSAGKDFYNKEVRWKTGHPKPEFHCVYMENATQLLVSADCNEEKRFLCEVRKQNTYAKAMQEECAEIWGIFEG
jgi:hypothetical protein